MSSYKLYEDIATRTAGDIYLGVVGPVRCGKSSFITNFVNKMVLPNIVDEYDKNRTLDELPQSADGKTIMTTQPHFVPKEAVNITVNENIDLKIKLVDCVGFSVIGAEGLEENNKPRQVKTPWSKDPMPFEQAAEIGTKKVINEHSTIAIVMTTDGSFGELDRSSFVEAEQKTIAELKKSQKPFVIVLNTTIPESDVTFNLCESLQKKYSAPVVPVDVLNLTEENVVSIFQGVLKEFPLYSLRVRLPQWIQALPYEDDIICEIISEAKELVNNVNKIGEINTNSILFENSENFEEILVENIDMGEGIVYLDVNDLKKVNDSQGHDIGDDLITIAAKIIEDSFGHFGKSYRIGGDEFCVLMEGTDLEEKYVRGLETFKQLVDETNQTKGHAFEVQIAHGFAVCEEFTRGKIDEAIATADNAMYDNKMELKRNS